MDERRVVIISAHPIFAEAIARLIGREAGIQVVGVAHNLEEALPLVQTHAPHTIIVDDDSASRRGDEFFPLLQLNQDRQIIFLTLTGNEMVVHHRERRENATPDDLARAIRGRSAV